MNAVTTIGTALVLLTTLPASAATVTLKDRDRGWYNDEGVHELYNTNYLAGDCTPDACGFAFSTYRNYFLFDLSRLHHRIVSATLRLWVPEGGLRSPTDTETFQLFDVVTDLDELGQRWGEDIFEDLGTGTTYGTYIATEDDEYSQIAIPLNAAAVADLNDAGDLFALGGAITSLDALVNDELLFGQSGYMHAFLDLQIVPVPPAAWLLASALLVLGHACLKTPVRFPSDRRDA
jgi:hypothetical protein